MIKDIMISKISQSQKKYLVWAHFFEVLRVVKITETEIRIISQDEGVVEWELLFSVCILIISVLQDENSSDNGDGCTTMWMYLIPLKCILTMIAMMNNVLYIF